VDRRRVRFDLDEVVYGIHSIQEALQAGEPLRRIHVSNERRRDPSVRAIVAAAAEHGVDVRFQDRGWFGQFPYKANQGVVAFGTPFPYAGIEDILAGRGGGPLLIVILDHLTDPHNAGAIIRTAECAGAHGLILPERRSVGVNATVRKAAAGAAAHLPVARVSNIADTVRKLKKANVWIAGADPAEGSIDYTRADFARDCAVVIGAEGAGLSQLVRRECDYLVRIPMLGRMGSLNASVAAGILLYEAVRQRRAEGKAAACLDRP
jgi:23S rRNA (guanosine2251-2'-O)-methyltransferase